MIELSSVKWTDYKNLAYIWAIQNKNLPKALAIIDEAIAKDLVGEYLKDSYVLDTKGWILHQMREYEKALPLIKQAVTLKRKQDMPWIGQTMLIKIDDLELHLHLGDVYRALGLNEQAKQEWVKGLSLIDPVQEWLPRRFKQREGFCNYEYTD